MRALADTPDVWVTGVSPVYETEPGRRPGGLRQLPERGRPGRHHAGRHPAAGPGPGHRGRLRPGAQRGQERPAHPRRRPDRGRRPPQRRRRAPAAAPAGGRACVRAAALARPRPGRGAPRPRPGRRPARRGRRGRASSAATTWSSSSSDPGPRRAGTPTRTTSEPSRDAEPGSLRPTSSRRRHGLGGRRPGRSAGLLHPRRRAAPRHRAAGLLGPARRAVAGRRGDRDHRPGRPAAPSRCGASGCEPHRAVNRLVLGRAGALVGALVAGGYAGYAVSWIGSDGRAGRPAHPALGRGGRRGRRDRRRRAAPRTCVSRPKGAPRSPSLRLMASPSATQATRRRQRSIRVTVAVGLIVLAALVVAGAALAAARGLLAHGRRRARRRPGRRRHPDHPHRAGRVPERGRTRPGRAGAGLLRARRRSGSPSTRRTSPTHQARIDEREQALDELEMALLAAQRRAATSTRKRNAEGRRAAGLQVAARRGRGARRDAQLRVLELEQEVLALRAELDAVTAAWHAAETSAGTPERRPALEPAVNSRRSPQTRAAVRTFGTESAGRRVSIAGWDPRRRAASSRTPRSWSTRELVGLPTGWKVGLPGPRRRRTSPAHRPAARPRARGSRLGRRRPARTCWSRSPTTACAPGRTSWSATRPA